MLTLEELLGLLNSNEKRDVARGLQQFCRTVTSTGTSKAAANPTLLESYIQSSPQCAELFRVWDALGAEDRHSSLASSLITAFALILEHNTAAQTRAVNTLVSRSVLRGYMQFLYSMISSDNSTVASAAIHLLSAMVDTSLFAARHVYKAFNWKFKPFERLLDSKKSTKGYKQAKTVPAPSAQTDPVRTSMIRFAVTFLRSNDAPLIQDLLQVKSFIPEVFQRLGEDTPALVEEFIGAVRAHVLQNKRLARKVKNRFFSGHLLDALARLYNSLPVTAPHFQSVEDFVQDLCKSPTWGIVYLTQPTDNVASIREKNEQILRFLRQLSPAELRHHAALILSLCQLCPPLLPAYLSPPPFSLEPRFSLKWFANVGFIIKLQQLAPPSASIAALSADFADFIALPCLWKQHLTQGLQHANRLVRYYSQLLVTGVFKALASVCSQPGVTARVSFMQQLTEELRRRLPDPQVIIAQLPRTALSGPAINAGGADLLVERGALLLSCYQRLLPTALHGANFDVTSLLLSPSGSLSPHLLLPLLRALNASTSAEVVSDSNVLLMLLTISVQSTVPAIYSAAYSLLRKNLLQCELFEGCTHEIDVWLTLLPSPCLRAFSDLIVATLKRPFAAIDSAVSLGTGATFSALFCAAIESAAQTSDAALTTYIIDVAVVCAAYQGSAAAETAVQQLRQTLAKNTAAAEILAECIAALYERSPRQLLASSNVPLRPVVRVATALLSEKTGVTGTCADESTLLSAADSILPEQTPLVLRWLTARLFPTDITSAPASAAYAQHLAEVADTVLSILRTAADAVQEEAQRIVLDPTLLGVFRSELDPQIAALLSVCLSEVVCAASTLSPAGQSLLRTFVTSALGQLESSATGAAAESLCSVIIFLAPHCNDLPLITQLLSRVLSLPKDTSGGSSPTAALAIRLLGTLAPLQDAALSSTVGELCAQYLDRDLNYELDTALERVLTSASAPVRLHCALAAVPALQRASSLSNFSASHAQMFAVLMPSNPYLYAVFARFLSSVLPSLSSATLQLLLPPIITLLERIASRRTDPKTSSLVKELWANNAVSSLASHTPRSALATKLLTALIRCAPLDNAHATSLVSALTASVPPSSDDLLLIQALMPWSLSVDVTAPLVVAYIRGSVHVPLSLYSTFWSALRPLLPLVPPAYALHTQSFDETEAMALVKKLLRIARVGAVELALELVTRFARGPALSQLLAPLCAAFASAAASHAEAPLVKFAELMTGRGITEVALFAALASLYTASLSDIDVSVLHILQRFELHGLTLSHVNYQWGRPISLPLPPPISPQDFGALLFEMRAFDQARLLKSIRSFPFTRALTTTLKDSDTYDPAFVLPFALQCVRRFKVDLRRFAEAGFLSYALCGLACEDSSLREQAYEVVGSVLALLDKDNFRDREQLLLILRSLRRSVTTQHQQIPSLFAQFMAQSVFVMLRSEHFLYPSVNKFLLARPTLDLLDVPILYECLSSSGVHFRRERIWLLSVLRGGLASDQDYKILKRRHVIELVKASVIADFSEEDYRLAAFDLLDQAALIPTVFADLIENSAWIGVVVVHKSTSLALFGRCATLLRAVVTAAKERTTLLEECFFSATAILRRALTFVAAEGLAILKPALDLFKGISLDQLSARSSSFISAAELSDLGTLLRKSNALPELQSSFLYLVLRLPPQGVNAKPLCGLIAVCSEMVRSVNDEKLLLAFAQWVYTLLPTKSFAMQLTQSGCAITLAALLSHSQSPQSEYWLTSCLLSASASALTTESTVNNALAAISEKLPHPENADDAKFNSDALEALDVLRVAVSESSCHRSLHCTEALLKDSKTGIYH